MNGKGFLIWGIICILFALIGILIAILRYFSVGLSFGFAYLLFTPVALCFSISIVMFYIYKLENR